MPTVRKAQATLVHGRVQRAHTASRRPLRSAATANENATAKPTYPVYSSGGCTMRPKSCSSGLRSAPSAGAPGSRRSKGLLVLSRNSRNPALSSPIVPSTRPWISAGSRPPPTLTAQVHAAMMVVQSRNEPS